MVNPNIFNTFQKIFQWMVDMPSFEDFKKKAMRKYKEALDKGLVDEDAKPINDIINVNSNFYTTSSCAGRITIDGYNGEETKKEHVWIGKWHRTVEIKEIKERLKEIEKYETVYFRTDPFIFHIGCKDLRGAETLLEKARDIGLKRSGIIETRKRVMVEIIGLDELHVPLKFNGTEIVPLENIETLVNLINKKQEKNIERRKKLEAVLKGL